MAQKRKFLHSNYLPVETEGNFVLELNNPVYKEIIAGPGHVIKNVKTKEIVGKRLRLHVRLYNMSTFKELAEPIYEEDAYEVVEE
jgi:hypothetical protein